MSSIEVKSIDYFSAITTSLGSIMSVKSQFLQNVTNRFTNKTIPTNNANANGLNNNNNNNNGNALTSKDVKRNIRALKKLKKITELIIYFKKLTVVKNTLETIIGVGDIEFNVYMASEGIGFQSISINKYLSKVGSILGKSVTELGETEILTLINLTTPGTNISSPNVNSSQRKARLLRVTTKIVEGCFGSKVKHFPGQQSIISDINTVVKFYGNSPMQKLLKTNRFKQPKTWGNLLKPTGNNQQNIKTSKLFMNIRSGCTLPNQAECNRATGILYDYALYIKPGSYLPLTSKIGFGPANHYPMSSSSLGRMLSSQSTTIPENSFFINFLFLEILRKISFLQASNIQNFIRLLSKNTGAVLKELKFDGKEDRNLRGLLDDCLIRRRIVETGFKSFNNARIARNHNMHHRSRQNQYGPNSEKKIGVPKSGLTFTNYLNRASIKANVNLTDGAQIPNALFSISNNYAKSKGFSLVPVRINRENKLEKHSGVTPDSNKPWVTFSLHAGESYPHTNGKKLQAGSKKQHSRIDILKLFYILDNPTESNIPNEIFICQNSKSIIERINKYYTSDIASQNEIDLNNVFKEEYKNATEDFLTSESKRNFIKDWTDNVSFFPPNYNTINKRDVIITMLRAAGLL